MTSALMRFLRQMSLLEGLIVSMIVMLVAAVMIHATYETAHPCLSYGPERVAYYQHIGDIMVPVYEKPCLARAGEAPR